MSIISRFGDRKHQKRHDPDPSPIPAGDIRMIRKGDGTAFFLQATPPSLIRPQLELRFKRRLRIEDPAEPIQRKLGDAGVDSEEVSLTAL